MLSSFTPIRCIDDGQGRTVFGTAVGRRFAFPDDVHLTVSDLQDRFKSGHRKLASAEGAYEAAYAWWIPGAAIDALLAVIVFMPTGSASGVPWTTGDS